jgi:uncharacterized OB-fold protein
LYSWTTIEHQSHPAFPTPYTIILVELDDAPGVRVVGRIDGAPDLTAGLPIRVSFEDLGEGLGMPQMSIDAKP